jgi:hypothetical protein
VSVREAVRAELLRPDDRDVETAGAEVIDAVGDEVTRRITREPRIRGCEDCDAHQPWTR